MPKVSLTYKDGVQKGPAPDYSMLLEMKRRHRSVAEVQSFKDAGQNGRKETGFIVDTQKVRGSTDSPVVPVFITKGAKLGFLKF